MVLVSRHLLPNVFKASIQNTVWTDHAAITCLLESFDTIKTAKQWTLNNSILFSDIHRELIGKEIKTFFDINNKCGVSGPIIWDAFKAMLWRGGTDFNRHTFEKRQE